MYVYIHTHTHTCTHTYTHTLSLFHTQIFICTHNTDTMTH